MLLAVCLSSTVRMMFPVRLLWIKTTCAGHPLALVSFSLIVLSIRRVICLSTGVCLSCLVTMICRSLMSAFPHLLAGPTVGGVFFFLLGTSTQTSVFFLMSKFLVPLVAAATAFHLMLDLGCPAGLG